MKKSISFLVQDPSVKTYHQTGNKDRLRQKVGEDVCGVGAYKPEWVIL